MAVVASILTAICCIDGVAVSTFTRCQDRARRIRRRQDRESGRPDAQHARLTITDHGRQALAGA
jgi:hypothetical protein